jgi:hypothetical protein
MGRFISLEKESREMENISHHDKWGYALWMQIILIMSLTRISHDSVKSLVKNMQLLSFTAHEDLITRTNLPLLGFVLLVMGCS